MGKVVVERKRKKKKGRPSLLDLQKRTLKLQQQLLNKHNKNLLLSKNNVTTNNNTTTTSNNKNNNTTTTNTINRNRNRSRNTTTKTTSPPQESNSSRRSTRRNPIPVSDAATENAGSSQGRRLRKRKADLLSDGDGSTLAVNDDHDDKLKDEKQSSIAVTVSTNNEQGSIKQDDGPSTPLPDIQLLFFILDSLQKKDTYGVFSEPVDSEELPDYLDVIEHPMDFSTVRKKLVDGAYANLEQFERDVFLISANAMEYNSTGTVYYRQARSIQELARKNFDNLRQDSDGNELEPEPKIVRRGRPPTNHLKRPPGRPSVEHGNSDITEAILSTPGGPTNQLSEYRKGSPHTEKHGSNGSFTRALSSSRNREAYVGRSADRFERTNDMIGSVSKGYTIKCGKKQIVLDESRRNSYSYSLACGHESSVLTTFHGERKQLIAVGLHTQYGYARSLARFAAKLGPVAWKVTSKRIEKCLPSGVSFGQGWVGENDAPTRGLFESSDDMSGQKPQREQLCEINMPVGHPKSINDTDNAISMCPSSNQCSVVSGTEVHSHQASDNHSRVNGINGSLGCTDTPPN